MKATLAALTAGALLAGSAGIAAADGGWRHDDHRFAPRAQRGWDRGAPVHRDFYREHAPVRPAPRVYHHHWHKWHPHGYRPYWRGHDGYRYGTYGGYGQDGGSVTVILSGRL